jgi:hypothetical protein
MKATLIVGFALATVQAACGQTNQLAVSAAGLFSLAPVQLRQAPTPAPVHTAPTNGEFTVVSEGRAGAFSPILEKRVEWVVASWTPARSGRADEGDFVEGLFDRVFPSPAAMRWRHLTISSGIQTFLKTKNPLTLLYPIEITF